MFTDLKGMVPPNGSPPNGTEQVVLVLLVQILRYVSRETASLLLWMIRTENKAVGRILETLRSRVQLPPPKTVLTRHQINKQMEK